MLCMHSYETHAASTHTRHMLRTLARKHLLARTSTCTYARAHFAPAPASTAPTLAIRVGLRHVVRVTGERAPHPVRIDLGAPRLCVLILLQHKHTCARTAAARGEHWVGLSDSIRALGGIRALSGSGVDRP